MFAPLSTPPESKKPPKQSDEIHPWVRGKWWKRSYLREYAPPISLDNDLVQRFLVSHGFMKK